MLDVHPPEHGIHGTRDFFMHLLTITVGLLIALALENAAEAVHHRHQRREAEEVLRHELEDNQKKLPEILASAQKTRENMVRVLNFLEDRREGKPGDASGIKLGYSEANLQSSGWKTVQATGVLVYMDPEHVRRYAGAYTSQQWLEESEARALDHIERIDTYLVRYPDPTKIGQKDIAEAIPDVRSVLTDLNAIQDIGRGTTETYTEALKQ